MPSGPVKTGCLTILIKYKRLKRYNTNSVYPEKVPDPGVTLRPQKPV